MTAETCPCRDDLAAYAIGRLSEKESEAVAGHVETCPDCQAELATLDDREDTFVEQLQSGLNGQTFMEESECRLAVVRAKAVVAGAQAIQSSLGKPALGTNVGGYELIAELGHGGMGTVFRALQTKLDRVVAVKVLPRNRTDDPKAIVRFEREMKAVGRLAHPNIVQAYDAREIEGAPVLIMEYIDGLDLAEIVRRIGPLPAADACELVRRTALALQCAHEHGLVHRDIKPSNVMLSKSGEVKLLDLGLARFFAEDAAGLLTAQSLDEMTGSGQAMGTADYMAPEQAADSRSVDIRADIYSLGCTLYKLLCGRAPFGGPEFRGVFDKMNAHVNREPTPLAQLAAGLSDELIAVVKRMLAKNPADRFASPHEAAAALERFCAGADLPALIARAVSQPQESWAGEKSQYAHSAIPRLEFGSNRRRSKWRKTIVGLAFFGFMGVSFAAGVVIMIEREGKPPTTLEVPDGSKVKVDEEGGFHVGLASAEADDYEFIDLNSKTGKTALPPESYKIGIGDYVHIRVSFTIPEQPIDGVYRVEPSGKVALPSAYGRAKIDGLSLVQAGEAIQAKLGEVLRNPEVSVTLAGWRKHPAKSPPQPYRIAPGDVLSIWAGFSIPGHPIHGPYVVEPDGQVSLGPIYGRVNLKGLTFEEAEAATREKLGEQLRNPEVSITLEGWRKEDVNANPAVNSLRQEVERLRSDISSAAQNKQIVPNVPAPRAEKETSSSSWISATGTLEPDEVIVVLAQVSGRLVKLGPDPRGKSDPNFKDKNIDYNSPVEEGDLLAQLDDTAFRARLEQEQAGFNRARAELQQAEAKVTLAESELNTALESNKKNPGTIARSVLDELTLKSQIAKAALSVEQANVEQSRIAVTLAGRNIELATIKSPTKGIVITRQINLGQNVGPDVNNGELFLIAKDLDNMQVWAQVNEADIGRIRDGMEASFTVDAFPNRIFRGKVTQIRLNAQSVRNVVTYTVVLSFNNTEAKLPPYLTANVKFETASRQPPEGQRADASGEAAKIEPESVFNGKTLAMWKSIAQTEMNLKTKKEAFDALAGFDSDGLDALVDLLQSD